MEIYCPCCGEKTTHFLCQVNSIPVMVNQLCRTKQEARLVPRGSISLVRCNACGTVWNCDYHPEELSYDTQYDNSQDLGHEYQAHFSRMVDFLNTHVKLKGKKVLEIGCGKGRFLSTLAKETGCVAYGVDPSYLGAEESAEGLCTFMKKVYDHVLAQSLGRETFDCIIMRQVFDQLPNPREMIRNAAFNLRTDGFLYIEGLEFQTLLNQRSILDLSYERYTYFTVESLKHVMSDAGIEMAAQTTSFRGQYMAVLGRKRTHGAALDACEYRALETSRPWAVEQDLCQARERLEQLNRRGKIALWGAANRGVMFCNLLDVEATRIDCVIDILPQKQGGYLPGSGHAIVAPTEIDVRGIKWVVVANKNYRPEIEKQLRDMGGDAMVLTAEEILKTDC